jgi:hypothetical protein
MTTAELSLVLFAVAGHPDEAFRLGLLRRLDAAIDAIEAGYPAPPRTRRELRTFFYKLDRRNKGGVVLRGPGRELAVRLALLAFSKPADDRSCRLHVADGAGGYVVEPDLRVFDLRRSSLTRHRLQRRQAECRFDPAGFRRRLGEVCREEAAVQATLRVEDRLVLEFRGAIPWDTKASYLGLPTYPGWGHEQEPHRLRLWPSTPEGVLRLTAGMALGKTIAVRAPHRQRGALLVTLRDFDDDEAALPVRVTPSHGEPWLARMPAPPLALTAEDRLAIGRWAYPLADWLNTIETELSR